MNSKLTAAVVTAVTAVAVTLPAYAQHPNSKVKTNAIQKSGWYKHPREIHIIDERPVVRDFREAPQEVGTLELPPGPVGFGGDSGGGGAGALGGDPGSTLPASGLPIGGPNQGYRGAPASDTTLPKSGFGRDTNIPARGMGPRQALPDGTTTNRLMGKMLNQARPASAGGPLAGRRGQGLGQGPGQNRASGRLAPPAVSTYPGDFGTGSGFGGSGSRTEASVTGKLIKRGSLLNK